jgi:ribosomal protein L24E
MVKQEACYYCGKQFIPGSDFLGNRFGIKTSKFSVVHLVCSKKCENEFYSNNRNKIEKDLDKIETFVNRNDITSEIHPKLKSPRSITSSEIALVIYEIVQILKEKGFKEKSAYLRDDYSEDTGGSRFTDEYDEFYFQIPEISKEILEKQFEFKTNRDWDLLVFICSELNDKYSPNLKHEQIKLLADNVYKYFNKSEGSGCIGSVILIMLVFLSGIYSIHFFTFY